MQDRTHRRLLINKLDVPIGRITTSEEVPSLEKRIARLRNQRNAIPGWSVNFFFVYSSRAGGGGAEPNQGISLT
jgi:hypothetical protein